MSQPSPIEAIVGRIMDGGAPLNVRTAAARGALPLPRTTLVQLQVFLLGDAEASVRDAAKQSLQGVTTEVAQEVCADAECPAAVLDHFAASAVRQEALAEKIVFHAAVSPEALARLAGAGNASVIDLVLTNQERLFSQPGLLERLMVNPALRADQRGRILELLDRVARREEKAREDGVEGDDEAEPQDLEAAARLLDVDVGELLSASEIMDGEEFAESEDPEIRDAYKKIVTLNTAQKAVLAMKGGREERMILIRDTNKVVALGVLKNGRITEQEIESIARMRNVCDDVLRSVGTHRDWIKSYTVILALVSNPRTPQGIAANFIPRLQVKDLKGLSKSRDVPELIRRNAKRTYDLRTQSQSGKFKKK
jgi:hypothetical protein